ncbi:MAG: hypothetical protein M5U34_11215 [Chloroflexi bacterium]|nr:hypothetical protein [Chloroflexota bacterium]
MLLLIALAIRVVALGSHPWILSGVEASLGLDMQAIAHGAFTNPFATGWLSNPTLPLFLMALPVSVWPFGGFAAAALAVDRGADGNGRLLFWYSIMARRSGAGGGGAAGRFPFSFALQPSRFDECVGWAAGAVGVGQRGAGLAKRPSLNWLWAGLFTGLCAYTYRPLICCLSF